MQKVVLTGGPSTGKSTTFEMLRETYPDAHFVPEAAELVIARELAKQEADPSYEAIMPVTHYVQFAPLVFQQQLELEANIPADSELVILDRSRTDHIGYLRYNGLEKAFPEIIRNAQIAHYSLILFCDRIGQIEQTEIRRENDEQAEAIHRHLFDAYQSIGTPLVLLPAISPEERIVLAQENIDKLLV